MESEASAPPSSHQPPHHQRRPPVKAWFVTSPSADGGSGALEGARLECCRGALIQKARPRGPRRLVSVEEAVFLASKGAVEICRGDGNGNGDSDDATTPLTLEEVYAAAFCQTSSSPSSHTRYVVFADLRSRGYVVDAPPGSRTQLVCVVPSAAQRKKKGRGGCGGGGGAAYTLHLHVVSSEDPLPVAVLSAAPFRHPAPPAAIEQRGDPEAGRKTSVQPALPQRGEQGEGEGEGGDGDAVYAVAVVTPVSEVLYYTVSQPVGLSVPAAPSGI
eukprot:Rhum_TRINITY_DN9385_c0_g1::Rhum_TRINITY_DN9385_c0_g1_i1::g.33178::m.33178